MTLDELKNKINQLIDDYAATTPTVTFSSTAIGPKPQSAAIEVPVGKPKRTDGKRAIRTKSTGDRVYLIDDNAKTKQWVTSPEVLSKLGFEMADVQGVEDSSLLGYQMQASIYKVD